MTGARGRVALQLPGGVSLRLDRDTRIVFLDAGHVAVHAPAPCTWMRATCPSASRSLRVSTPAGVVWHVGTQYEARLVRGATRIRVREGRVDLVPLQGVPQSARVGEELLVSTAGNVARSPISRSDPEWRWAADAAPTFEIDGRPVSEFLTWVGRELGSDIVFDSPASEAEAERAVLSGSVKGLAPARSARRSATDNESAQHRARRQDRDLAAVAALSGPTGRTYLPPGGAYFSSHSRTVRYQNSEFCGFSTQ